MLFPRTSLLALAAAAASLASVNAQVDNTTLWVNAIVGENNVSTVQCWGIQPGFTVSSQAGTVGNKILQLGSLSNASYTEFAPGPPIDSGLHNAPNKQYVVLLAGSGNINFPDAPNTPNLTINAGDVLIAVDVPGTSAIGHRSVWVGGSIALQMPLAPDFAPNATIFEGACSNSTTTIGTTTSSSHSSTKSASPTFHPHHPLPPPPPPPHNHW